MIFAVCHFLKLALLELFLLQDRIIKKKCVPRKAIVTTIIVLYVANLLMSLANCTILLKDTQQFMLFFTNADRTLLNFYI